MLHPPGNHTLLLLNPPFFRRHMEAVAPTLERFFSALPATPCGVTPGGASATGLPSLPPGRITALVVVPAAAERRSYEVRRLSIVSSSWHGRTAARH